MSLTSTMLNAQAIVPANSFPFGADSVLQSNPDINGNYQTVQYFVNGLSGKLVRTLTLVFDGSSNLISAVQS